MERLLNEAGDDAGQLPVLQHTLRQTFKEFEKAGAEGEINLGHYEDAGKLKDALNRHAEALLDAPADPAGGWTGKVFRCLTTVQGGRKVRRPTERSLLYDVVGARDDEKRELVRKVIERYSDLDCSMVALKGPDPAGRIIADISHESLIPGWKSLDLWVDAEAEAVRVYRTAADDVLHYAEAGAQWRGVKLDEALAYMDPARGIWNQAWAGRLAAGAPYEQVCDFLRGQKAQQDEDEKNKEAQHAKDLAAAQHARRDAEALAASQVLARQAAETAEKEARDRAAAEAEARKAAEAAARAALALERTQAQKKRWAWFAGLLVFVVLGLCLTVVSSRLRQAESDRARAQSDKARFEAEKKLTAATDYAQSLSTLIAGYDVRLQKLSSQVGTPGLQRQKDQIESLKNAAHAALTTAMKSRTSVNPVDGLTYLFIPPGAFTMGCSPGDNECDDNERPHAEQIANGFWLGQTEVTQAAWKKVMNNNPSHFQGGQLPVEQVDWNQAGDYCKKAIVGGRLPTEREWEYAARAGDTSARYGPLDAVAWYSGNSGGTTHPVGLKQANVFGLYDMLGSMWEWTVDNYDTAGKYKVVRGGSWDYGAPFVRASERDWNGPAGRSGSIGFRCVGEFR